MQSQSQSLWALSFILISSMAFSATHPQNDKASALSYEQLQMSKFSIATKEAKNFFKTHKAGVLKNAKGDLRYVGGGTSKKPWATLDLTDDGYEGTSTEKVYQTYASQIRASKRERPIIVAVIDSGVDIHHEDLQGKIWVNEVEAAGIPGVDDDGNGYIDDVYGWNFLGNSQGDNVVEQTLEVTREYVRLSKKKDAEGLTPEEQKYFDVVAEDFLSHRDESKSMYESYTNMKTLLEASFAILSTAGLTEQTLEEVQKIKSNSDLVIAAKEYAITMLEQGSSLAYLEMGREMYQNEVNYYYNTDFDSSKIVKNNPNNPNERYYGNPIVNVRGDEHGTHVSGIIAANRDNNLGMYGQASNVLIMPIRAVPDGDELDKDIANAVRYAVDNGAQIINMSFGKGYSPLKSVVVDQAFDYAEKMGVLVVHAAGNSSQDIEVSPNYPSKDNRQNWIEVGASALKKTSALVASFSNYGQSVDLFAPGVSIMSTVPGNGYDFYDGTSMASPEVAGVAALLWSLKPDLTAQEIRTILMSTVQRNDDFKVMKPGSSDLVSFSSLSKSGGIVNAFNAAEKVLH